MFELHYKKRQTQITIQTYLFCVYILWHVMVLYNSGSVRMSVKHNLVFYKYFQYFLLLLILPQFQYYTSKQLFGTSTLHNGNERRTTQSLIEVCKHTSEQDVNLGSIDGFTLIFKYILVFFHPAQNNFSPPMND